MITDLGFHHHEKAAFMVLLAGFCLAFTQNGRSPHARSPLRP